MVCGIHNHALCHKLVGLPIVLCLISEEKKLVFDMTSNMVQPKNILSTLKRKRPENVSNIKRIYNVRRQNNKAVKDPKSEMQQLLKRLDYNHYATIFSYK